MTTTTLPDQTILSPSRRARLFNRLLHKYVKAGPDTPRTVERLREGAAKMDRVFRITNAVMRSWRGWQMEEINGVTCYVKRHAMADTPILVHLHGGSFTMFSPQSYIPYLNNMASRLNATVIMPDYRLAPEDPFPAGLDDCVAVLRTLDADRLLLSGESAGGNLALASLQCLREQALALPRAVWASSAPVDLTFAHLTDEEMQALDKVDAMLSLSTLSIIDRYVDKDRAGVDPLASPLLADMTGYPPLLLDAGGAEFLHKDPSVYAAKARAAGVSVADYVYPAMPHAFTMFGFLPEAQLARTLAADFFRQALRQG